MTGASHRCPHPMSNPWILVAICIPDDDPAWPSRTTRAKAHILLGWTPSARTVSALEAEIHLYETPTTCERTASRHARLHARHPAFQEPVIYMSPRQALHIQPDHNEAFQWGNTYTSHLAKCSRNDLTSHYQQSPQHKYTTSIMPD